MNIIKKVLLVLLAVIILLNLVILFSGNTYIYPALINRGPELDDYKFFNQRTINVGSDPQEWPLSSRYNHYELTERLRTTLEDNESTSFLVIKDDSIHYEEYYKDHGKDSYFSSASVAKSFTSTLVGIALTEGHIKSLDQPVANYLPSFNKEGKRDITIEHLLQMSSGLKWEASATDPFSHTVEAYYASNLWEMIDQIEPELEPGQYYQYSDGDALLLGFILRKATGKTLSKYIEQYFWYPQRIPDSASWSLDRENGMEKAFCCLNMTTRAYARLGDLYLHKGFLNGKQILDSLFIEAALTPTYIKQKEKPDTPVDFFGYIWRIYEHDTFGKIFYASGFLGQKIIIIPGQNMIVVNIGNKNLDHVNNHPPDFYVILDEIGKIF